MQKQIFFEFGANKSESSKVEENWCDEFSRNSLETQQQQQQQEEFPDDTHLSVSINNVVCAFNTGCGFLDIHHVGRNGVNVYYKRSNNMLTMRLRKPGISANIYASGRVNVTGASSLEDAKMGSRRVARALQKLGFDVRIINYRVTNILASCFLPYSIRLTQFATAFRDIARFEPEINAGVIIKNASLKTTLKIFSTGTLIINAHDLETIRLTLLDIMPKIRQFRLHSKVPAAEVEMTSDEIQNNDDAIASSSLELSNVGATIKMSASQGNPNVQNELLSYGVEEQYNGKTTEKAEINTDFNYIDMENLFKLHGNHFDGF